MNSAQINDLKKQVDILSLCGTLDIKLNKSGQNNYMTRCPFPDHEDKNPSFSVDGSKGLYHCFGCGRKGDQISLVRELKGFSFPEALSFLDERFNGGRLKNNNNNGTHKIANLTIKSILSTEKTYTEEQKQELLSRVANHYHKTFKENDRAIEYLKKKRYIFRRLDKRV